MVNVTVRETRRCGQSSIARRRCTERSALLQLLRFSRGGCRVSDATLFCSTTCAHAIALEGCSSAHDKTENREANVQECNGVKSVYDSTQRHRERVLAMGSCHGPFSVDTLAQPTKWSDRSLLMMEKMSPLAILDNPQICQKSTWVPQPKVGSKTVPGPSKRSYLCSAWQSSTTEDPVACSKARHKTMSGSGNRCEAKETTNAGRLATRS